MSKGWDNATLKKLKALVVKGLSTSEIGKRLGMSKNAVVGKLNRLGWNSKAGGITGATAKKVDEKKSVKGVTKKSVATNKSVAGDKKAAGCAKAGTKVNSTRAAKAESTKGTVDKKSLTKNLAMHQRIIQHSLEMANLKPNQCRWPIGDPDSENFHFCGATVFVGKPYCYEHCKLAYQFTPPKKKQAQ